MPAGQLQFVDQMTLEANTGASNAFEAYAVIQNITPPRKSVTKVERRRLVNPGIKEFKPGNRVEMSDVTITYEVTAEMTAKLDALLKIEKSWRITTADGQRTSFTGWIQSLGDNPTGDDPDAIFYGTATIVPTSLLAYTDQTP